MANAVIVKPNITPEERLKRLNNVADVLTRVTGRKCEYIGTESELKTQKSKKRKKA